MSEEKRDTLEARDNADLDSVDWANLSPEDFGRMLADAMENQTDEEREELRQAELKYLAPASPWNTMSRKDRK